MKKSLGIFLTAFAAVLYGYTSYAATPQIVAHRGYWHTPGLAQNSLHSLALADSVGAWGSEFDVWRSADGKLFCNHDHTFKGVTFTAANSKVISAIDLDNGEPLPSLADMLEEAKKHPGLRLVFELKEHPDKAAEELAVKESVEMINDMGLAGRTDYITFSKQALRNFVKYAPAGTEVYYLTGDLTPGQVKVVGASGIDYNIHTLKANPGWIDEAHALGMKVNVWTVDEPDDMQWCIDSGVDFITTNRPDILKEILMQIK